MSLFLKAFIDILARETENAAKRFGLKNPFEKKVSDGERETDRRNENGEEDTVDETKEERTAKEFKLKNIEKTHVEEEIEFYKENVEKPLMESIEKETKIVKERIRYEMKTGDRAEREHALEPP